MPEKIVVPVLGESITEATVSKWLKSKGDTVEADEPIVELETDKVNLEVPSPSGGILGEINFEAGSTVEVGTTLGSIMGGQSVAKTDKIEKIKAETESLTNGNDNIIKLDEEIKDRKIVEKIILCDVQKEIYPNLEKIFITLLSSSGFPNIKFEKKIDFEELYNKKFN